MIEQGKRVEKRKCPIEELGKCTKCKPFCNITSGFSGAGAFSDGKLSLYNKEDEDIHVGGNLHRYIGVNETKKLIDYTDKIYHIFTIYSSKNKHKIKKDSQAVSRLTAIYVYIIMP